jgi:hypothetical protein
MDGEAWSRKRWGGGGLLLLALLAVLLAAPLFSQRGNDHPLASVEHPDVCALLPAGLVVPGAATKRPGADRCDLLDAQGEAVLGIGLSSLRSLGTGNRHGTRDAYATWIKEVRASGAVEVREEAGPWKLASSYTLGSRHQLLVEDGGLLIVLDSTRLDAEALVRAGATLATALRQGATSAR